MQLADQKVPSERLMRSTAREIFSLNPPYVFLRDYVGIADPNAAIYEFAGHVFNYVMLTHIIFQ